MPDKHIKFGESLLGLGSHVLESLAAPKTIDELWTSFRTLVDRGGYPTEHPFEHLVLAVDVLYAIGAVKETDRPGVLRRCA
ncbi:MAG: hypothetical protein Q7T65_06735 [Thiobacillus sp.]|nr:hypothetical protein [Thiobacillus sp.]